MEVITDAGAIRRGVVVAEDGEFLALPRRDLGHVGHEIVGRAGGVFTDQPGGMRADGIEIAQQGHRPPSVGMAKVLDEAFDHRFAGAIGVAGLPARQAFVVRHGRVFAIHGGRGAEHQPMDARAGHGLAEGERPCNVGSIVGQRLRHAVADGLEASKMDDGVNASLGEKPVEAIGIVDVAFDEVRPLPGQARHALQGGAVAVDEIVEHGHPVAVVEQLDESVGADVSGAAGHE